MKRNDYYLITIFLIISLVIIGIMRIWQLSFEGDGAVAVVTVDGVDYGSYPLSEDKRQVIDLEDGKQNIFVIKDGAVYMEKASCPDQICVKHAHIRYENESIVCLPNKVVIRITGGKENEVDATTY